MVEANVSGNLSIRALVTDLYNAKLRLYDSEQMLC
jgi:hypothetical protein